MNADAGAPEACVTAGARCTGTLIAPNLVLTARHCVDSTTYDATVYCNSTFDNNIYPHPVVTLSSSALLDMPTWLDSSQTLVTSGNNVCDDDLALIVLRENVPSSVVAPIDVDVDTNVALSKPNAVAIVGRGASADQIDLDLGIEHDPADGLQRRLLQNVPFLCASDTDGTCSIEDASTVPATLFSMPRSLVLIGPSVAPGDSGSAILDQDSYTKGKPKVIAIATLASFGTDGKRNGAQGVRASLQRAFLLSGAQQAASTGGYALPAWAGGTAAALPDAGGARSSDGGCSMTSSPDAPSAVWWILSMLGFAACVVRRGSKLNWRTATASEIGQEDHRARHHRQDSDGGFSDDRLPSR